MKLPIIIITATAAFLISVISVYSYLQIERLDESVRVEKLSQVDLVSSHVQSEVSQLADLLQVTGTDPNLISPPAHVDLISRQLMGVPGNVEAGNRMTAREILRNAPFIEYVFYSLPNGDLYFLEPFSSQTKLTKTNFAFRDWYRGAIDARTTYISEAYISDNERHKVVAIAVPLYSNSASNGTLEGLWVGALNLVKINEEISSMTFGKGEYIIISDANNDVVVDSRQSTHEDSLSPAPLDLRGKSHGEAGTEIDEVNNTKVFVAFEPIHVGTRQWYVMAIQPYDEAFLPSSSLLNESIMITVIVIIAFGLAGFIIVRSVGKTEAISKKLEDANSSLEQHAKRLIKSDSEKEEFSAMITHELKTPLVPILGYCKMLKTAMLGKISDDAGEAVDVIEKNAKRLEELIGDIMDARKLDIGKMKFSPENIHLEEFFKTLNSSYKEAARQRGIEFVTRIPDGSSVISADRIRLRQVFDNLISNSMRFVREKDGIIEVGSKREGDSIILHVKDNGIGIPPERQKDLFKKFYQVDTSERRQPGGTGLGLAISKGIIEKMGGKIWIESDGRTGTTVQIKIGISEVRKSP